MEHIKNSKQSFLKTYWPLIVAFALVVAYVLFGQLMHGWNIKNAMTDFMGSFFLIFGIAKLFNLNEFASLFKQYDVIAQRISGYAYAYPFIELALAFCYLTQRFLLPANIITLIIMGVGAVGVGIALYKKSDITCACLGSLFNIPLTTVTLIENTLMVLMAIIMLILS